MGHVISLCRLEQITDNYDAATADWDGYDNTTASLEALNVDTDAIKAQTATIVNDTDLIDDGTSGLAKIATDVAAILVDTGATLDTKINDIQGSTFNSATDSLEKIRDRGDSAWITGIGGSDRLLLVDTTIATLATQTSFTLTTGSTDNDAYNNCTIVVEDVSTATQKSIGMVLDYVGSTKTVTLKEALAFTISATDKVYILAENSLKSTVVNRQLDVTANGAAGIDWANVENPTTAVDLSGTDIQLVDITTVNTDMRGTDSAATATNLATVDTVVDGIQADLSNGTDGLGALKTLVDTANTDLSNGTDGLGAIKTAVDAIPTTAMRGTDSAATATNLATVDANVDAILVDTGTTLDTKLNTIDDFLDTEIAAITAAVITNAAGADVAADIIAMKADTAAILTDTGTTLDTKLNTIDDFLDTEIAAITAAVITNAAGVDIAADIIAVKAETAAIVNDTDLIDDSTSGLAKIASDVAAVLVDTGTTLDGKIDTIDNFLDTEIAAITAAVITNAAGVDIAADIIAIKAETALIVADTNELQGDWTNGGRLDLIIDSILVDTGTTLDTDIAAIKSETALIVADTSELQGDWANGGRLDLLIDAIKVPTDKMVFTKANELDSNTKSINDAEVVGDGNATPWDGA